MHKRTHLRTSLTAASLALLSGCTRTGVNAGEEGGKAFILMAIMLIAIVVVLWFILGRED